jgi:uncharacterized membrane protein YkgB
MIIGIIFFVSALQLILYWVSDKISIQHGKLIITIVIVLFNLFVFPEIFTQLDEEGRPHGISALIPKFWFWIFGNILAIVVYLLYIWY